MAGDSLSITQTGLQGVENAMQAVSDNLANEETVGFKAEQVDFGTLLGDYIAGNQLGGGVIADAVTRDFSEGAIVQSNSPTDLAIQGNGFFVFQDSSGNLTFSRNGQMTIGNNGDLLSFNGSQVMGYPVSANGTAGGVLAPIVIPQGILAPIASSKVTMSGNLNGSSPVITGAINPADPTTYDTSVSVQVFDSLGNSHVLTFYLQNAGPSGGTENWNWLATLDGSTTGLANNTGTIGFNSSGQVVSGGLPASPLTATVSGAAPLSLSLDFSAFTQYGAPTSTSGTADGNAPGRPSGVQVDSKGIVSVTYSNGRIVNVAQVAIATFTAQQGLALSSGGVYQQTATSGPPTIGTAGAGSAGSIQPSSLENSNVDLTSQLVALVLLQRSFEANAKALQTQDNILGSVVQIQTS
jgi:flagellar hook protein FlgE